MKKYLALALFFFCAKTAAQQVPLYTVYPLGAVPSTQGTTSGTSLHNLGHRFTSDASGMIVALQFWKAPGESGVHTGSLWDLSTLSSFPVAHCVYNAEGPAGWQTCAILPPYWIEAGKEYIVSRTHYDGQPYWYTPGGNAKAIDSPDHGPLHYPADVPTGKRNGIVFASVPTTATGSGASYHVQPLFAGFFGRFQ